MVHLLDRRTSCGQPIIITEHTAESLTPGDRPVASSPLADRVDCARCSRPHRKKAIQLDPQYAAAYAELGETYLQAVSWGWTGFPRQALDQTEALGGKALWLDPANAHALRLLSYAARKGVSSG
jgi:hypothetical protein